MNIKTSLYPAFKTHSFNQPQPLRMDHPMEEDTSVPTTVSPPIYDETEMIGLKRHRDGNNDNAPNKRLRIEGMSIVTFPADVWNEIGTALKTQGLINLSRTSRNFFSFVWENLLKKPSVITSLSDEYVNCVLQTEILQSHKALRLYQCSANLLENGAFKAMLPLIPDLEFLAETQLNEHTKFFSNDVSHPFILDIFKGKKIFCFPDKDKCLEKISMICQGKIEPDNDYTFFQIRKILEYVLREESGNSCLAETVGFKAINCIFIRAFMSIDSNNQQEFNTWTNLLKNSVNCLKRKEKQLCLTKCQQLLQQLAKTTDQKIGENFKKDINSLITLLS